MTNDSSSTLGLARELIQKRSLTPDDEGCQEVIAQRLAAIGFQIEHMPFGDVSNFWARHGTDKPVLCFAGHTDVVPTGPAEQWCCDPFAAEIIGDDLYGRGAADMKGGLAAMLTATEAFIEKNPNHNGSIAFLVTSDEEGPAKDGTRRVVETLEKRKEKIDWCVVGEPSSQDALGDVIRNGRRGSLDGQLVIHGEQGHVAYAHLARNPVLEFAPALVELGLTRWDDGDQHFPATGFQISNVAAGTGANNVIPGEMKIDFNFRYSPQHTDESLKLAVVEVLDRHGLKYELEWNHSGAPFYTQPGRLTDAMSKAIMDVTGAQPELSTGGGTSDGRFIAPTGAEVVEFGLVNRSIHKLDEHTKIADLDTLAKIYQGLLQDLLTVPVLT